VRSAGLLAALLCGWVSIVHSQAQSLRGSTADAPPVKADAAALAAFPPHPSRAVVLRACVPCHAPELVVAKRRTAEEWDRVVATMIDRGAVATDDEQQQIFEYLVRFFGPEPTERSASGVESPPHP
jgi:hypothetical protein